MTEYPLPKASKQHRLGQYFLEAGLFVVTLGIGYIVWTLDVLRKGQTPGKQILKLRVYDATTGKPAKWGHMFIRELGLWLALAVPIYFPLILNYTESLITPYDIIYYVVILIDAIWIFKGDANRRLVDVICKTDVLNEASQKLIE